MNIRVQGPGGGVEGLAIHLEGNPIRASGGTAWRAELEHALAARDDVLLVAWSGTPADDLFAPDPRAWMHAGHEALRGLCDAIQPRLETHGRRLCFRPHCRHALNDPQSCLTFLGERGGGVFDVALAPAAFLEASMLGSAADHLRRAFEALGATAPLVFLHDVTPDGGGVAAVPLGHGSLPRETTLELLDTHVPPETPIVLVDDDLDGQRAWLAV